MLKDIETEETISFLVTFLSLVHFNFMIDAFQARALCSEALLGMVAPGTGLRGATLFRSKNRQRPKRKGLRRKISGFLVQMGLETKENEKQRFSPQISGVMVSHHIMVSPQNGVT